MGFRLGSTPTLAPAAATNRAWGPTATTSRTPTRLRPGGLTPSSWTFAARARCSSRSYTPQQLYTEFSQALSANSSRRPMILNVCNFLTPGQINGTLRYSRRVHGKRSVQVGPEEPRSGRHPSGGRRAAVVDDPVGTLERPRLPRASAGDVQHSGAVAVFDVGDARGSLDPRQRSTHAVLRDDRHAQERQRDRDRSRLPRRAGDAALADHYGTAGFSILRLQ